MPLLSVVVITRNQEGSVPRLIESVLSETQAIPETQVILVDSASSDGTVEVASRYPIDVVRLHGDQRLSAAAGRYTGYRQARGEFILFLDGDMALFPGWLPRALDVITADPQIACITGDIVDVEPDTTGAPETIVTVSAPAEELTTIPHGRGGAMYRRAVFDEVGAFNPYVISDEEPELGVRIRLAGYRIVRLSYPIALHYTLPAYTIPALIRRRRSDLFLGAGQNMRYLMGTPALWPYIRERGFAIPTAGVLVGAVALLVAAIATGNAWLLAVLAGLVALVVLGILVRKGNLNGLIYSLMIRLMILEGTVRGFFMEPLDPATTPLRYDVVKRAPQPGSNGRQPAVAGAVEGSRREDA